MATSKETSNYKLPLYAPNDVTSYLVTWNGAMTLLDTTLANIQKMAEAAGADVTLVEASVDQLKDAVQQLNTSVTKNAQDIQSNTNTIAGVKVNLTTVETEVANLRQDVEDAEAKVGEVYRGVIGVGEDTLTVNAANVTDSSLVDVYTDEYGLVPKNVTVNVTEKLVTVKVDSRKTTLQVAVVVR